MPAATQTPGIKVWHDPKFPGLCFYRGTGVTHRYPRHWHDELHLATYEGGSGYFGHDGITEYVVPNDFMITAPGEVHENWVPENGSITFRSIYIDMRQLREITEQITGKDATPDLPTLLTKNAQATEAFNRMHRAMELREPHLLCEELLLELFEVLFADPAKICARRSALENSKATIRRVRHFIDENYAEPISLTELGRLADLNPFHLHAAFRRETGMPPHAYQIQVRVNRAKEFLRQRRQLSEVALASGFADQSHFTRHFRRLVGVTPGCFCPTPKNVQDTTL